MSEKIEKTLKLKNGCTVSRFGQGTWYLGQDKSKRTQEIETLRRGIELGMTLIDTAEMYGEGRSEELVGEAISGADRRELFIVSKVYPHNAGKPALERSLDMSLKRLGTDYLDMYLLHWRGRVPFSETVGEMERMESLGKIKSWGVSNLDIRDMKELMSIPAAENCQTDQVLYHLGSRGIEFELQPWLRDKNIAVMAYCPIAQGGRLSRGLMTAPAVLSAAKNHGATPTQVLLNFVLHRENVIAIPKSSTIAHVEDNARALDFSLTGDELEALNRSFPSPTRATMLDIV